MSLHRIELNCSAISKTVNWKIQKATLEVPLPMYTDLPLEKKKRIKTISEGGGKKKGNQHLKRLLLFFNCNWFHLPTSKITCSLVYWPLPFDVISGNPCVMFTKHWHTSHSVLLWVSWGQNIHMLFPDPMFLIISVHAYVQLITSWTDPNTSWIQLV